MKTKLIVLRTFSIATLFFQLSASCAVELFTAIVGTLDVSSEGYLPFACCALWLAQRAVSQAVTRWSVVYESSHLRIPLTIKNQNPLPGKRRIHPTFGWSAQLHAKTSKAVNNA
jgi:hypothetical protein